MIFRGDGKNNIVEANCFSKFLRRSMADAHATAQYINTAPKPGEEAVTRVFMNPPFALKEGDAKEYRFVESALKSMADGGLLFAIVPMSVMAEGGDHRIWRKDTLLARRTVLAVISLPAERDSPVANQKVPHRPQVWRSEITAGALGSSRARRVREVEGPPLASATGDAERLGLNGSDSARLLIDSVQPIETVSVRAEGSMTGPIASSNSSPRRT